MTTIRTLHFSKRQRIWKQQFKIFFSEIQRNKLEFERDVAKIAKTKGSGDKDRFAIIIISMGDSDIGDIVMLVT